MIPEEQRWGAGSHFVSKAVEGSAASHYVPASVPRHINFYDPTGTDLAALSLNKLVFLTKISLSGLYSTADKSTCLYQTPI